MAKYWIKIVVGALVVFGIGMAIAAVTDRTRDVVTSDATIEFPLAFLPFRIAGERLGEFRRVRIERAARDSVTGVHLRVQLDDTTFVQRLGGCTLVARDIQQINEHSTFECVAPGETAGLVPLGTVRFTNAEGEYPFLVPAADAGELNVTDGGWAAAAARADSLEDALDAQADSLEAMADSIAEAAEAYADSVTTVESHRVDSIRTAELHRADSIRQEGARRADSIRAAAR